MKPSKFARLLWGDAPEGLIQVWRLRDRRSFYFPHPGGIDVIAAGQPDVYIGVGLAHKDHGARRRCPSNRVAGVAGLWLDLDVGPGKARDLAGAVRIAQLVTEPTILVRSGGGLHAWWLFEQPWRFWSPEEQAAGALAAAQWHALHRKGGARLDATHDLARLLRLPGTLNGKGAEPLPVEVLPGVAPDYGRGPRYERADLLARAAEAGTVEYTLAGDSGAGALPEVDVAAGRPVSEDLIGKIDALRANLPDFDSTWRHTRAPTWTDSEYDLSLCSLAAQAGFTDQELADLIAAWRRAWSRNPQKADRATYVRRTIAKARGSAGRDGAIAELGRMADAARAAPARAGRPKKPGPEQATIFDMGA